MAINPNVDPLYLYQFEIKEKYGDVEINMENGCRMTDIDAWQRNEEAILFWKDYCKQHKKPYVVMIGKIKPEYLEKHETDSMVGRIRHAVWHPQSGTATVEAIATQTKFEIEFVTQTLSKLIDKKQIEAKTGDGNVYYVPFINEKYIKPKIVKDKKGNVVYGADGKPTVTMYNYATVSAKYKKKPFPFEKDEVCVLLRPERDFNWV